MYRNTKCNLGRNSARGGISVWAASEAAGSDQSEARRRAINQFPCVGLCASVFLCVFICICIYVCLCLYQRPLDLTNRNLWGDGSTNGRKQLWQQLDHFQRRKTFAVSLTGFFKMREKLCRHWIYPIYAGDYVLMQEQRWYLTVGQLVFIIHLLITCWWGKNCFSTRKYFWELSAKTRFSPRVVL